MLPVIGAVLVISLRATMSATSVASAPAASAPSVRLAAWVPPLAAVTVGLLPSTALHALLGVG
jgi:hypothetical protein